MLTYEISKDNGTTSATLTGTLDVNAQNDYRTFLAEFIDGATQSYRIDLKVDRLDSTGLGLLIMLKEKAKAVGGSVVLSNPNGAVLHVLTLANFDELFTIEA